MNPSDAPSGYQARLLIAQYERWRKKSTALILITLVAFLAFAIIGASLQTPVVLDTSKLGVHVLLDDGRNRWDEAVWEAHLRLARDVVGAKGWVVQVVRGDDLDVTRWQKFLDLCAKYNLTPILRLATTYDPVNQWWTIPPADADGRYHRFAQAYADFVAQLTWHKQPMIILFNEPNNGREWGGTPDPSAYVRVAFDVASAIREQLPETAILNGALDLYAPNTGSGTLDGIRYIDANTFFEGMVATEPTFFNLLTIWNNHSYPIGFALAPNVQNFGFEFINDALNNAEVPPKGIVNRGINGYTWELWKLERIGITHLRVIISESGWKHAETVDDSALDTAPSLPTADLQAQYWAIALSGNNGQYPDLPSDGWTPLLSDTRVIGVIPFALNGLPAEWGHSNWLSLDAKGQVLDRYPIFDIQQRLIQPQ